LSRPTLRSTWFRPRSGGPVEARLAALVDLVGITAACHNGAPAAGRWGTNSPCRHPACRAACAADPPRPSIRLAAFDRSGAQQRLQLRDLVALARGGQDHQRPPTSVGAQVELGAQPAAACPPCLICGWTVPLFRSSRAGRWRRQRSGMPPCGRSWSRLFESILPQRAPVHSTHAALRSLRAGQPGGLPVLRDLRRSPHRPGPRRSGAPSGDGAVLGKWFGDESKPEASVRRVIPRE
jgi:hypothetical protein